MDQLAEAIIGVIVLILGGVAAEIRRRQKAKSKLSGLNTDPPPPNEEHCRRCFFYKEVRKRLREDEDTRRFRLPPKISK